MNEVLLVEDLIKYSITSKSKNYDELKPKITIILPTFRRAKNNLFKNCVDSLLNQTFKDFEIIIIDDASTDGTRDIIEKLIKEDNRICTIRHQKNIGLPAISCYEGFMLSRADKIFFAFDDNKYINNTLEILYEDQIKNTDHKITFASTKLFLTKSKFEILGNQDFEYKKIIDYNYIPNSPLLIDKKVIEEVGFYDPHICISRLCDWDLWIRVGLKYQFYRIDKTLAEEYGPTQQDSIGNSHKLDANLVREWITINRNDKLKPVNFHKYNVLEIPKIISIESKLEIFRLTQEKLINQKDGYIVVIGKFIWEYFFLFKYLPEQILDKIIFISEESFKFFNTYRLIKNANSVILSNYSGLNIGINNLILSYQIPYIVYFTNIYRYNDLINNSIKEKEISDFLKNSESFLVNSAEEKEYLSKICVKKIDVLEFNLENLFKKNQTSLPNKIDDANKINILIFGDLTNTKSLIEIINKSFQINNCKFFLYFTSKNQDLQDLDPNLLSKIDLRVIDHCHSPEILINSIKILKINFFVFLNYNYFNLNPLVKIEILTYSTLSSSILVIPNNKYFEEIELELCKYNKIGDVFEIIKRFTGNLDLRNLQFNKQITIAQKICKSSNSKYLENLISSQRVNKIVKNSLYLNSLKVFGIKIHNSKKGQEFLNKIFKINIKDNQIKIKIFGINLINLKFNTI